ncbi:MAG TPA: hypothetical protein VLG48_01300 [Candidatus Methylomirabilis sp.]|nr:hypothetical protein [Candidatus Methylomirabilis sp.]
MKSGHFARAAYRALTTAKNGPTLYDLCDPLLAGPGDGDAHLRRFYKKALANPMLRLLLARACVPQLREEGRLRALIAALRAARDDASPDWTAIGKPLAELIDEFPQQHPMRTHVAAPDRMPTRREVDRIIGACARHLLDTFARRRFIPAYAAFKLVGDPDFRGRDLLTALRGLKARTYKNATLLFNLARVFVLANPHIVALLSPPWRGLAEPMWDPVQIRHRTAYYDAFFAEALMDFIGSGLATPREAAAARHAIADMVTFCLETSREGVRAPRDGQPFDVITALVPPPHSRMSKFFWQVKSDLGFGLYVPDFDTTACSFSAATQFGSEDPILEQPLLDLAAAYQVGNGSHDHWPTVTINDIIEYDGGVVSWIENSAGDRPFGNDLDPTLNLDLLEASFRNHERWQVVENPRRLQLLRRIVRFQDRLTEAGVFGDPRAHIYYLPELYCAYFGRCYGAFQALPPAKRGAIDPEGRFEAIRHRVLAYVRDELMAAEMNPFDAALALLALAKLDAEPTTFTPALDCIVRNFGEGRAGAPFKAYEWNKMKKPTRILIGGPEATSAFVLSALVHARAVLREAGLYASN